MRVIELERNATQRTVSVGERNDPIQIHVQ